jgi:flavin reductase (DIM6/NTAB) family NADH-FMN oxidoreductase RutF
MMKYNPTSSKNKPTQTMRQAQETEEFYANMLKKAQEKIKENESGTESKSDESEGIRNLL